MKGRRFVIVLLALHVCGTGLLAAQKERKTKEQKGQLHIPVPDEQQVNQTISEMLAGWQLGDIELLRKSYADDVTVVSGAWEGPLVGWASYLKAYETQRGRMQGGSMDRRNTLITVRGNLAWADYQWEFRAVVDGKPAVARGHTTLVLEKRKERWLIVHNHTSLVPEWRPPEPASAPGAPSPKPAPPSSAAPPGA